MRFYRYVRSAGRSVKRRVTHGATIKAWLFPAIVIVTLLTLTSLRISGSSVGQYYVALYGDRHDPALIMGEPRPIRSDELGVTTPATVSQTNEGFPVINQTIGNGQDMSVALDVPVKEWASVFRPQNWSFFLMPLEYAFAFKWWFLGALLMLSCYFFVLTLLPKRYLLASLVSVGLFFSPFIQWWYQSITILPIAHGLLLAGLILHFLSPVVSHRRQILLGIAIAHIAACFAFVLYVPFVVPVSLGLACLLGGHIANLYFQAGSKRWLWNRCLLLAAPLIFAVFVTALFLQSHASTLRTISQTVYPGDRIEASGGIKLEQLAGGYYNMQLLDDKQASHYNYNQSEASNFILLFPFLIPFFIYLFVRQHKHGHPFDWRIFALLALTAFFLARLFLPFTEIIFNTLQLNRIPHNRLFIGLGFINICLIILAMTHLEKIEKLPPIIRISSAGLAFLGTLVIGLLLKANLNGYLENIPQIFLIAVLIAVISWLLLDRKPVAAMGLLAAMTFLASWQVNPLYRGLGVLSESRLAAAFREHDDRHGKWVVGDYGAEFENLPSASGVNTLSGVYAYPQLDIWKGIGNDPASKVVYNRYAHVFFTIDELDRPAQGQGAYFDPPALDAFRVHADACSDFLDNQNVRRILLTVTSDSPCLRQADVIKYPKVTFYIYEVIRQ